jgi:DNA-binding CsgD family transcriptional regulator
MAMSEVFTEEDSDGFELVRARLRTLVRGLDGCTGHNDDNSEQMLLDIDLDGQRYLLIRMPAIERKAASLSPREIEIVRLVAGGHPNKVIAAVLEISSWTVCTHMRRVFAKLGVNSRAAMIARVAEFGGVLDGIPLSSSQRAQPGGPRHLASQIASTLALIGLHLGNALLGPFPLGLDLG